MFFRPNFCANCGEKVERAEWGVLTSRRFCQVCESEYKGQDLIPRVVVGLGIVIGMLGFGSYLNTSPAGTVESTAAYQPRRFTERKTGTQTSSRDPGERVDNNRQAEERSTSRNGLAEANVVKPENRVPVAKTVISEPAYFCGAETKKGTPCSRRVKGNTRCFQHPGMPAMVSAEKLRIENRPN